MNSEVCVNQSDFGFLSGFSVAANTNTVYHCYKCDKSYKYLKTLKYHQRYDCGKEPNFVCTVRGCTFRSKRKGNLQRHCIDKHQQFTENVCPIQTSKRLLN